MVVKNENYVKYKLLLDNAHDMMLIIQGTIIQYVNIKPLADFGFSIEDVDQKDFYNFIHVDDREKVEEFQRNKAGDENFPDDLVFRIVGGKGRLVFGKLISIKTEWNGEPARLVCVKNITDIRLNDLTVKNSAKLLFIIIDNLPDPTLVIDVNGNVFLWNKKLEAVSGVKSEDVIGKGDFDEFIPFQGYKGLALVGLMRKSDAEIEKEYDFFHRTGEMLMAGRFLVSTDDKDIRVLVSSSVLYDIQGNIIGAVESFRDLTDITGAELKIKDAIREKEMLLKEIHHRVKNNMQLINSMLAVQLQYVKDPDAADLFQDSVSRIQTMALIHNELYRYEMFSDVNAEVFVPKLINNLCSMYDRKDVVMTFEVDEIHLGIDDAIPMGLILNELVSNSLKHAYTGEAGGAILVKIRYDAEASVCTMIVHDDGRGLPHEFDFNENATSFGLLMVNLLTSQLKGTIRINSVEGTEFIVTFPIRNDRDLS
ncbi:MAG: PAS domain S-box protein [Spirochaetes bacterium]|nr:PAS domain S-box protein [Spirochaetota bacterium]